MENTKQVTENLPILEIKDVHKSFNKKKVLDGVNFNVFDGESIAIVGENGAGKTVLMETIVGLTKQDNGEINFNPKTDSHKNDEIGFQFQDSDFPPSTRVKTILNFYKDLYRERIDEKEIEETINIFGINNLLDKKISKLSGGQKQRLNLLFAIIQKPKLMILDEFITGLDIRSIHNILEYINKIKKENNSTLIIITHQPEEIHLLADRILVLKNGKISDEFEKKDILGKWETYWEFLMEVI